MSSSINQIESLLHRQNAELKTVDSRYNRYVLLVMLGGILLVAAVAYFFIEQLPLAIISWFFALIYTLFAQRDAVKSVKTKYTRIIAQIDDRDFLLKQKKLIRKNVDFADFFKSLPFELLIEKQGEFLKALKIFYFMDVSLIDSLYNQATSDERLSERIIENNKTSSSGITTVLPISPTINKSSSTKESSKANIVYSNEKKFNVILDHLLTNDIAKIGLEDFDYDPKAENEFITFCENLKEKSGFDIPENVKNDFIKFSRKKYVKSTIEKLKKASGYIIMSGVFSIDKDDDSWSLNFQHPVSDSMSLVEGVGHKLIFKTKIAKNQMTRIGDDTFMNTDKIKIILFGNIVKFEEDNLELIISPISVYA